MPFDGSNLEEWQITLLKAAEIVRERWQQGMCGRTGGPRCAGGAIMEVEGRQTGFTEGRAFAELQKAVRSVPNWNDELGRTAEEVARVMESVATQGRE